MDIHVHIEDLQPGSTSMWTQLDPHVTLAYGDQIAKAIASEFAGKANNPKIYAAAISLQIRLLEESSKDTIEGGTTNGQ